MDYINKVLAGFRVSAPLLQVMSGPVRYDRFDIAEPHLRRLSLIPEVTLFPQSNVEKAVGILRKSRLFITVASYGCFRQHSWNVVAELCGAAVSIGVSIQCLPE